MSLFLPDCLDIQPDDSLSGFSCVPDIKLEDVTGDYPFHKAEALPDIERETIVYLYICSSVLPITDFQSIIPAAVKNKIRKVYLVQVSNSYLSAINIFRQYAVLRKYLNPEINLQHPMLFSNGGTHVMTVNTLPSNRNLYLEKPFIKTAKSYLKYYWQLFAAISKPGFAVFDISVCLNY